MITATTPLPPPWEISVIQPELKFCMRDKDDVNFKFDDKTDKLFADPHIRNAKRFVFVVHGFLRQSEAEWMTTIKNAVFEHERSVGGENSVIVNVSWAAGAKLLVSQYSQAVSNSQIVGAWLGLIVKEICNWNCSTLQPEVQGSYKTSSPPEIVGVGHSLGSHLLGAAGRTSRVFDVITGLDPAGPLFQTSNIDKRLSKNDAKFVQAIHTDGFNTPPCPGKNYFGTVTPLGHLDFYPNWGYEQPGVASVIGGSHRIVVDLFIWSITNPGKFITNKKMRREPEANKKPELKVDEEANDVEMGYHVTRGCSGCYYIRTNATEPWNYEGDYLSDPDPKLAEEENHGPNEM